MLQWVFPQSQIAFFWHWHFLALAFFWHWHFFGIGNISSNRNTGPQSLSKINGFRTVPIRFQTANRQSRLLSDLVFLKDLSSYKKMKPAKCFALNTKTIPSTCCRFSFHGGSLIFSENKFDIHSDLLTQISHKDTTQSKVLQSSKSLSI